ncbi:MAG: hypothetical protein GX221_03470 [Candidatus Riflebacteria bacterium]|nr:hypothetical protein [Candidatus Riflebacteria bacterium]
MSLIGWVGKKTETTATVTIIERKNCGSCNKCRSHLQPFAAGFAIIEVPIPEVFEELANNDFVEIEYTSTPKMKFTFSIFWPIIAMLLAFFALGGISDLFPEKVDSTTFFIIASGIVIIGFWTFGQVIIHNATPADYGLVSPFQIVDIIKDKETIEQLNEKLIAQMRSTLRRYR